MKLDYVLINKDYKDYRKVKHLFEHAFPIEERPPFNRLIEFNKNELYAVESNNTFIGLVDQLIYEDILYVFFLALKKTYRQKGYGSEILKNICEKYSSYRIYLLAEDPNAKCNNKIEREKRIGFYHKNGFNETNEVVVEYGVQYLILCKTKKVTKEEFKLGMRYALGDHYYFKYYLKNVK